MPQEDLVLLQIDAAARLLSVSRSRAYALAARGQLPGAVRLGRTWRVNRRALEEWADGATSMPDSEFDDVPVGHNDGA